MLKKFFLVFLSVMMLASGTACSSEGVLHFTLFDRDDLQRNADSKQIEKWYRFAEEYMGMKIEIDEEILTTDNIELSCEEYVRRNNLADVFLLVDSSGEHLAELAKQGKIINLMDYKEYMPNYSKILEKNLNYEIINIEGGVYGFATLNTQNAPFSQQSWLYNYTVFQKHGISIPENMDELYQAAKKLKQLYPDSYPIMFYSTDLNYICESFGFLNRLYLMIDYNGSEYEMGLFEHPREWKDTIAYMNRLYREGLIGAEFDSYSAHLCEFNASNERTFIIPNTWGGRAGTLGSSKNQEWVCGNTPKGFGNKEPFYSATPKSESLDTAWNYCISAEAEHPELLVKLIDHDYSAEAIELYNWGEEGKNYSVDSSGKKQLIPQNKEEYEKVWQKYPTMQLLRKNNNLEFMMEKNKLLNPVPTVLNGIYEKTDYRLFSQRYITDENVYPGNTVTAQYVKHNLTEKQKNTIDENLPAIKKYIYRELRRFITGERSLNEWEAFIEEAKQQGDYRKIIEIYNAQLRTLS